MNKIKNRTIALSIVLFIIITCCGGLLIFKFEELWARFIVLIGAYTSSGLSASISLSISQYHFSKFTKLSNNFNSSIDYNNIINEGIIFNNVYQTSRNEDVTKHGISLKQDDWTHFFNDYYLTIILVQFCVKKYKTLSIEWKCVFLTVVNHLLRISAYFLYWFANQSYEFCAI